MKEKSKDDFWDFGDLVAFRGRLWRFVGMDEDGIIQLVRQIEEHAFGCIEFENVYHDEWDEIKLKKKSPIKNPYPGVKPYKELKIKK